VAIGLAGVLAVIVLVIVLGGPEFFGRFDRGDNSEAFFAQQFNQTVRDLLLLLVCVENGGAVLIADVRPLAVTLSGVVDFEKELGEVLVSGLVGVEDDLDGFGVPGFARADLLVGGMLYGSSHIAGAD